MDQNQTPENIKIWGQNCREHIIPYARASGGALLNPTSHFFGWCALSKEPRTPAHASHPGKY